MLLVLPLSCSDDATEPPHIDTEATRDFEAAWRAADTGYPLFDFKEIDWDGVHDRFRPRAEQTESADIHDLLYDLIGELKDAHANVPGPLFSPTTPFLPERVTRDIDAFRLDVVKKYFSSDLKLAGHGKVRYGVTDDNVGYIHISTLIDSGMMDDFYVVMEDVYGTIGLIVDVRGNLGGIIENVKAVVGRFIESPMESFAAYTVNGHVDQLPYNPTPVVYTYTNPVVVLVNGACISSPEALAEMMQRVPSVTLLGDTTGGAGCWSVPGAPGTVTLPSGRTVFIPTAYMVREDGEPWEWNGIAPDILVKQTPQDIDAGVDKQLEAAIDLLN